MSQLDWIIEESYKSAKKGRWSDLLSEWAASPVLAKRCSRYRKPESGWTFLHQAAYFGNKKACQELISRGASIEPMGRDGRSPEHVAEQRGHHELAEFLRKASLDRDSCYAPSEDPDVLPSSCHWAEAKAQSAPIELFVGYGGSLVRIPKGSTYFIDALGRVLVGWHGTYNPPSGMGGESMIQEERSTLS